MKAAATEFSVLFFVIFLSCNNAEKSDSNDNKMGSGPGSVNSKIETRVFRNDTIPGSDLTGFGYNIAVDGKPYVHQPHVPAVSGLKGFQTEEDARKAGEFAARKFEITHALPMITPHELDSLGIKY